VQPRSWRDHFSSGSEPDPFELTTRNSLPAAWTGVWATRPHHPLLCDVGGAWTHAAEFEARTRHAAARLLGSGLAPGDRVAVCLATSLAGAVAHIAALRAGLVVVPMNPRYTDREIGHIVADARPTAAIVDDSSRERVQWGAPQLRVVLVAADFGTGRGGDEDLSDGALDRAKPDDPALVAYTSGTTGAPKGAVLSHANVLANSESVARTWRWNEDDRLIHALPIFHGHGLCVGLYTTLLAGASAVLLPSFDRESVLDAMGDYRATMFFGVPTMYHRLARSARVGELGRLRLAVSGSAPLPADLHRYLWSAGTDVLERYGMTETLMTISNPYEGERRPGTVGFPFPGVDVEVEELGAVDGDDAAGGEITVRGPAVFRGYWQRPAATREAFAGEWFRTGDLAAVEDGYVRILGRSTDLIVSGGYNVYPAEVEDVLLTHPSVADAAVTGVPSDEWGEVVTAWVVPDGAATFDVEALLEYAAARLAPYKRPRLVRCVDVIPRNSMGKVRRSTLR
jgi:malonyl-CoA/methylmalonyl-CoA synthetase